MKKPLESIRPKDMNQETTTVRKAPGRLGHEVQARIGQHLRAMYDDVVSQGVPDRFSDLLKQLDDGKENKEQG